MNNISHFSNFSDSDFLSFLYQERERVKSKQYNSGWTFWALGGSIFTLLYFSYSTLKNSICEFSFSNCYYYLSVFIPFFYYVLFLIEHKRGLGHGDMIHIRKVSDSNTKLIFAHIAVISVAMIFSGFFLNIRKYLILGWISVLFFIIIFSILLWIKRNKYVTSNNIFVVSNSEKINSLCIGTLNVTIILPFVISSEFYLSWKFCCELEFGFAFAVLITLLFFIIRNTFATNQLSIIDDLIDVYIYSNWSKKEILKRLEFYFAGLTPSNEVWSDFSSLINMPNLIEKMKRENKEILEVVNQKCASIAELEYCCNQMTNHNNLILSYLKKYESFFKKSGEIFDLETTWHDEDFKTMFVLLTQNKDKVIDIYNNLDSLYKENNIIISKINNKLNK